MTVIDEYSLLTKELDAAIAAKNWAALPGLESRIDALATESANQTANQKMMALIGDGGSALPGGRQLQPPRGNVGTPKTKGWQVNPIDFDDVAIQRLTKSMEDRTSVVTKAFNTVESLLPAQLAPGVVARQHENRFLDQIPTMTVSAPSYEFLVDNTSSNGVTAPTAEGATKPDVSLAFVAKTVQMIKLAATFGLSYETISDHSQILGYCQSEVTKQIIDLENAQLLDGSGTGGNIEGLLNTTGILTEAVPGTLPTGANELDYFQKSLAALRVGPALAVADQIWINPTTWSALAQIKDLYGRYLIEPDPVQDATKALFGVSVHQTTAMPTGTAILLDSNKFGYALVREGITIHTGQNNDDFSKNIQRWAVEERIQLAVNRPAAVLALTGLPTTD